MELRVKLGDPLIDECRIDESIGVLFAREIDSNIAGWRTVYGADGDVEFSKVWNRVNGLRSHGDHFLRMFAGNIDREHISAYVLGFQDIGPRHAPIDSQCRHLYP